MKAIRSSLSAEMEELRIEVGAMRADISMVKLEMDELKKRGEKEKKNRESVPAELSVRSFFFTESTEARHSKKKHFLV